jgi:hypothetical protein
MKYTFIFALAIGFFACDSDLSREQAETLIKDKLNLPQNEIRSFALEDVSIVAGRTAKIFQELQGEGVLTYTYDPRVWSGGAFATLTENGRRYVISQKSEKEVYVMAARLDFGEIKGIKEIKQFNAAEVEYTLIRTGVSPFGRIAFNLQEKEITYIGRFIKYDDGWRMK